MTKILALAVVCLTMSAVGCDGRRELKVSAPYDQGGARIEAAVVETTNWRGRTDTTTESRIVHPDGQVTPVGGTAKSGDEE